MKPTYLNPSIVPFIKGQFPPYYRENWPLFVSFLEAYYEYLETEGQYAPTTYYTRGFLDLRDADRTIEDFFVHLKTKYLDGIQLNTESDSRLLLKHAKDLYRAKGTPRGLELFFRLLYNESINIYYPKDDILRMSSGTWTKPFYLELSVSSGTRQVASKAIVGLTSGATGFVDSTARRMVAGKVSVVAYMSAVTGTFQTGEIVTPVDGSVAVSESPTVVGSLNSLIFSESGSGSGYAVGDVLPINSPNGILGEARVKSIVNQSGLIQLNLIDGGYGFTSSSQLQVADTIIVLSNIMVTNSYARKYSNLLESLTQPIATYNFVSANGTINAGDQVFAYTGGGGTANVLRSVYTNSTAGFLQIAPLSGNLQANTLYSAGNTVSITKSSYVDQTVVGYTIGSANLVLRVSNQAGQFAIGEDIVMANPLFPTDGSIQAIGKVASLPNGSLNLANHTGNFVSNGVVIGRSTGAVAHIDEVDLTVGMVTSNGNWTATSGNWIYGPSITANVSFVSSAITSRFGIANVFAHTETVSINTDTLASIANDPLAGPYGLTANPTGNATSTFSSLLTFANVTVGAVTNVYTTIPGQQVDARPIVTLVDLRNESFNVFDLTMYYTDASHSFSVDEVITQEATGARGLVKSINATAMHVTNLRMNSNNQFVPTSNSTTIISGAQSGSTANVASVWANRDSPQTGRNANTQANTTVAVGAVTAATVVDSGLGYVQGEQVWLGTGNTPGQNAAYGIVQLRTAGTSRGFYSQNGGFMSDDKKFFDGDYYQEFSYEISSSHQLEEYVDTLKRIMHVAGMKVFGRYVHSQNLKTGIQANPATISVSG